VPNLAIVLYEPVIKYPLPLKNFLEIAENIFNLPQSAMIGNIYIKNNYFFKVKILG